MQEEARERLLGPARGRGAVLPVTVDATSAAQTAAPEAAAAGGEEARCAALRIVWPALHVASVTRLLLPACSALQQHLLAELAPVLLCHFWPLLDSAGARNLAQG